MRVFSSPKMRITRGLPVARPLPYSKLGGAGRAGTTQLGSILKKLEKQLDSTQ